MSLTHITYILKNWTLLIIYSFNRIIARRYFIFTVIRPTHISHRTGGCVRGGGYFLGWARTPQVVQPRAAEPIWSSHPTCLKGMRKCVRCEKNCNTIGRTNIFIDRVKSVQQWSYNSLTDWLTDLSHSHLIQPVINPMHGPSTLRSSLMTSWMLCMSREE